MENIMHKLIVALAIVSLVFAGCRTAGDKTASDKPVLASAAQTHWVNHIYDETFINPEGSQSTWGTIPWINIHGFEEAGGIYWVGADSRCWGIRMTDMVIKCKNKATYDKYINLAKFGGSGLLRTAENDSALYFRRGNNVNTEFIFRWGNDDKSFDVRLVGDFYAEEK